MKRGLLIGAAVMAGAVATQAHAQTSPIYIADGDSSIAYVIQNGTVQTTFPTFSLAYPIAVGSTVRLGHLLDGTGAEYTLAGAPTGTTYAGSNNFGQMLDGATDGVQYNYAVECCDATNSVVRTDLNWEGSTELFPLTSAGSGGTGIAYDTSDDTLFVSTFNNDIQHYSLAGVLLGSYPSPASGLCCLAYDEAAGSLWALDRNSDDLIEFDKTTGAVIQTIDVPGFSPNNPFGGEIAITGAPPPPPPPAVVPTLTEWAMMLLGGLLGLSALWAVNRRRFGA